MTTGRISRLFGTPTSPVSVPLYLGETPKQKHLRDPETPKLTPIVRLGMQIAFGRVRRKTAPTRELRKSYRFYSRTYAMRNKLRDYELHGNF